MDNLRAVIKNLFCYIQPNTILSGEARYDNLNEKIFTQLGNGYIAQYSNDELHNLFSFLENEFQWHDRKHCSRDPVKSDEVKFNVFDALVTFDNEVLIEESGEPVCQYKHLLRWREMIMELEEDLFTTSFLAYRDMLNAFERKKFFWKPAIGHNSQALNALVAKGVSENHFHLKGSAPQFQISWLRLMNCVDDAKSHKLFSEYEENRLQKRIEQNTSKESYTLERMWHQAALLRLYFFMLMKGEHLEPERFLISIADVLENCNEKECIKVEKYIKEKGLDVCDIVEFEEVKSYLENKSLERIAIWYTDKKIWEWLQDEQKLKDSLGTIQKNINRMRETYGKSKLDYMVSEEWLIKNDEYKTNELLSGERWFLYSIFKKIYTADNGKLSERDKKIKDTANWFYFYLVLKAAIRNELVQANHNVGFDNFLLYQNRKDQLIEDTEFEPHYIRMAVRDTIQNQHIQSLEARIAPKESAETNILTIRKYDKWICEGLKGKKKKSQLKEKYFYVYHFAKDSERIVRGMNRVEMCRHAELRERVERQAYAIADMRRSGSEEATRVLGIDACSPEIWCRPEVFAQAFRYLKNHNVYNKVYEPKCPKLWATYHVGEDFLDVTDGLRAIDEAICFLNLKCGDRLGHALALGIDIDEWYKGKAYRILISKMAYMDNLVWLYAKLRYYMIPDCDNARAYIEKRFREYFNEIYRNNMHSQDLEKILEEAKLYYDERSDGSRYNHTNLSFGINEYYDAWKLRGDNPELYKEGFYKTGTVILGQWGSYAVNKEFPVNYQIRYQPEVFILYHMYHYNEEVKIAGDQMVEVRVNPAIIDAVKKVRNEMQKEICEMGISIEANPSSNYFVGTFRRYDKHPIVNWYNNGLTADMKKLQQCPQIQVSINTDDQGVFSTYLENEYAYLALALEKCKDENGERIYNRTMILQWLNNIRKIGNSQSFMQHHTDEED